MGDTTASFALACAFAYVFGLKHGLDADHLATIDGLTRYNARANPRLARFAGALFSLGHGVVVVIVALAAATLASRWRTPGWLEITGATVSVIFLFGLAYMNARAVLSAPPDTVVPTHGIKGRMLGRFVAVRSPWAIAAVGVLFAVSFDTVSQAALFALAAAHFGGVGSALVFASLFFAGMLTVDGLNGMWISRLVSRADRTAVVASRVMALGVAGISFTVGAFTVAKLILPSLDAWADAHELWFGVAVMVGVVGAFLAAIRSARRSRGDDADVKLAR
ncbi:MAG: nickel transporter [Proteobacteria bacterium]|nr:nickel transporter [Pseudomonadota bacterium]